MFTVEVSDLIAAYSSNPAVRCRRRRRTFPPAGAWSAWSGYYSGGGFETSHSHVLSSSPLLNQEFDVQVEVSTGSGAVRILPRDGWVYRYVTSPDGTFDGVYEGEYPE